MIISNLITIIILVVYFGIVYITINNKNQLGLIFTTILTYLLISYKKNIFESFGQLKSIQTFNVGGQVHSTREAALAAVASASEAATAASTSANQSRSRSRSRSPSPAAGTPQVSFGTCITTDLDECATDTSQSLCEISSECTWNSVTPTCSGTGTDGEDCNAVFQDVGTPLDASSCPTGCTYTDDSSCTTALNPNCPSGDSVSRTDCPVDNCTFNEIIQNCSDFPVNGCQNHPNELSFIPSTITCSGPVCTANECCTEVNQERQGSQDTPTCSNFNCSPYYNDIQKRNYRCVGRTCSPLECCILPDTNSQPNSQPDSQSGRQSGRQSTTPTNAVTTVTPCTAFDSELNCTRNRCIWDSENTSCNEPDTNLLQERIKETDPIPIIKGNHFVMNNNISSYDGLCINTGNDDYWKKSPDNLPLVNDKDLYTLQGHASPLKPILADYSSLYGPSINGEEDSPNKLFLFANNISSPACCPSTFTTSTGCLCTSKKQRDFIISRGKNVPKNYNDLN